MSKKAEEPTTGITIRLSEAEKTSWEADAGVLGQTLTTWVRRAGNAAIGAVLPTPKTYEKATTSVTIRVTVAEKASWDADAREKGQTLTTWVRRAGNATIAAALAPKKRAKAS